MSDPEPSETPTFEQALARLEAIVGELERGDQPLERAVTLCEEAAQLAALCRQQLDDARARVEQLTASLGVVGADGTDAEP